MNSETNNLSLHMEGIQIQNPPSVVPTESVATTTLFARTPTATIGNGPADLVSNTTLAWVPTAVMPTDRPEKFSGLNFKTWQQKMHFNLRQIGLVRYLTEETPTISDEEDDPQVLMAFNTWKDDDYMCRNYVLNILCDTLYKVNCIKSSTKELWESLERMYTIMDVKGKTKDNGVKCRKDIRLYCRRPELELKTYRGSLVANKVKPTNAIDMEVANVPFQDEGQMGSELPVLINKIGSYGNLADDEVYEYTEEDRNDEHVTDNPYIEEEVDESL
ncbi:hypothetical protein QQ045_019111 [Rhodiola kirilowii]